MNWTLLIISGFLEILFVHFLKASENFTRLWPFIGMLISASVSLFLLSRAMQTIPLGTAYAVWTGIGAVGISILGIVIYNDPISTGRVFFMTTLILSIIGLKYFGGAT